MYKGPGGRMRISHFLGKGGIFGRLSRRKIFPRKTGKGIVLKPIFRDMGVFFRSFPRNKKTVGMIYTHMFPEPSSIASWEKG